MKSILQEPLTNEVFSFQKQRSLRVVWVSGDISAKQKHPERSKEVADEQQHHEHARGSWNDLQRYRPEHAESFDGEQEAPQAKHSHHDHELNKSMVAIPVGICASVML